MKYKLQVDDINESIRLDVNCLLSNEIRMNLLVAVLNHLLQTGYSRVLIDVTGSYINQDEPVTNAHEVLTFMISIGFTPAMKIAVVYLDAELHRHYFENISHIKGLNIKYFKNLEEGDRWLCT